MSIVRKIWLPDLETNGNQQVAFVCDVSQRIALDITKKRDRIVIFQVYLLYVISCAKLKIK